MSVDPTTPIAQCTDGLHERTLDGITVLHRSDWDKPQILNRFSSLIWLGLSFGVTAAELTEELGSILLDTPLDLGQAVTSGLEQLDELGLIQHIDSDKT